MSESKIAQSGPVANANHAAFYGLWLFIILVSVLDGFLALRYRHLLSALELNPVGRSLIAANDGRVWYLLFAKFMGTVVACAILLLIHYRCPQYGLIVGAAVASLQLCLLLFLLLA